MSAIGAIFQRDGAPVDRSDIERMGRALAPYGHEFRRTVTDGPVGLACALNAFTPEDVGQRQPVIGGGGRYTMLFEGRLDNRDDLIEALGLDRAAATRMSDAALALAGYERWSTDAFLRWIGDFAVILWDSAAQQLLLARDPFGNSGLIYWDSPDRFVVATVPRGLHALPYVPRELDDQKLADLLVRLLTDKTRTFYAGLRAFPPGHYVTIDAAGVREHCYYRFRDHVRPVRYQRDADYVEAALQLTNRVIAAQLRARTPVGAMMSGGLDSSTLSVLAAPMLAQRGERLHAFTWVPESGWDGRTPPTCYGDETPYVRAIVDRHPNIELNLLDAAGLSFEHGEDAYLRMSDMPVGHNGIHHWFHVTFAEMKRRGISVALNGASGNKTISYNGDGVYFDLFRKGRLARLWSEMRPIGPGFVAKRRHFKTHILSGFLSDSMWDRLERMLGHADVARRLRRYSMIHPEFARDALVVDRALDTGVDFHGRPTHAGRRFWYHTQEQLAGGFAPWKSAMAGLYGVDMRDPLGDRRLVEWCFGVPEEQFRRDGTGRWLIRRMMQGVLPDSVLYKPVENGRVNADWHLRQSRDLEATRASVARMADDPSLARMIDIPRLRALLDDWPEQAPADHERLVQLMVAVPRALHVGRFVQLVNGTND